MLHFVSVLVSLYLFFSLQIFSHNGFCYVCGVFVNVKSVKYTIVEGNFYCSTYKAYFGVQVGDQDKSWVPHMVCGSCGSTLELWYRGEK